MSTSPLMPVSSIEALEADKGGKGGTDQVTNHEFISSIFNQLPDKAFAAVCSKPRDPGKGGWPAKPAHQIFAKLDIGKNNYLNCSSFYAGQDGTFKARKDRVAACHFLMLDDLGTKVPLARLADFELSWLIETSPGNHQGGIILAEPIKDKDLAVRLLTALIDAQLCDPGASGPLSRWARLPVAINGKPKYAGQDGEPFRCRLIEWRPDKRYKPEEIMDGLQLALPSSGRPRNALNHSVEGMSNQAVLRGNDIFIPKSAVNPVVAALKARGLYKSPLGSGKHDVTCPWVNEHTDALDSGTAYFEPDDSFPVGGFCCQHSHRQLYHIKALLEYLGIPRSEARHKPVIRIIPGELHRIVDTAEQELAARGRHYQSGGLIVVVMTDPSTGDPSIVPVSASALVRELSAAVTWEKPDARSKDWVRCDPPPKPITILHESQTYRHLPVLDGVARQPYFRESDRQLITEPGYDPIGHRFGVFDPRQFQLPEPTRAAALKALSMLQELLTEFSFVGETDKSAALAGIFTACVRTSIPLAPAFHVRSPVMGSGKTYLCELIGAFAGPGGNAKVSYPTTSEEATKVILSLLLPGPAVIEFDDMDTNWTPHGTIKRMLTSETITDRILGASKTATVSTRTLLLGSGNNVGPVRDLLRRVISIHLDPRCQTPATISYQGSPVERVRSHRGEYVAAVLTIIHAWFRAGSPRAAVESIASFSGAWADYCRHPLLWLGLPDPATALLNQLRHDPDSEALLGLMTEWYALFGSTPTTIRKALERAGYSSDLYDAICELPTHERGEINRSKLGWILKKNANRIVDDYEIQEAIVDGRNGWRVVKHDSPPLPPLPPPNSSSDKTVSQSCVESTDDRRLTDECDIMSVP